MTNTSTWHWVPPTCLAQIPHSFNTHYKTWRRYYCSSYLTDEKNRYDRKAKQHARGHRLVNERQDSNPVYSSTCCHCHQVILPLCCFIKSSQQLWIRHCNNLITLRKPRPERQRNCPGSESGSWVSLLLCCFNCSPLWFLKRGKIMLPVID